MAIYVCGDIHQDVDISKLIRFQREHEDLTKNDYVIVCGDFGLLWNNPYFMELYGEEGFYGYDECDNWWSAEELDLMQWYENCPWTTLWVDGNHECYDRIKKYPITEWHDGLVQVISPSIIHLLRGEIYDIDGYSIFCMGGAMSTDRGTATNTADFDEGKWWWPQEIPSDEEWRYAHENLEAHGNKVDFIITHDCPAGVNIYKSYRISSVSNHLEMIRSTVDFKRWFCGHLHMDEDFGRVSVLYQRVVPIEYDPYQTIKEWGDEID